MTSITDYVVTTAILYHIVKGFSHGFLKTLLGPLSLIIGIFCSYFYYAHHQNLMMSLCISIVGPFAIRLILSIALRLWNKAIHEEKSLSLLSRLAGACFSTIWSGGILVLIMILISFLPGRIMGLEAVQKDILASKSYAVIQKIIGKNLPSDQKEALPPTGNLTNPQMQEVLKDKDLLGKLLDLQKEIIMERINNAEIRP